MNEKQKLHQANLAKWTALFKEPELLCDDSQEPAVTVITVSSHTRKSKSIREYKLAGLPACIFEHTLSKKELTKLFSHGYKELPCVFYIWTFHRSDTNYATGRVERVFAVANYNTAYKTVSTAQLL